MVDEDNTFNREEWEKLAIRLADGKNVTEEFLDENNNTESVNLLSEDKTNKVLEVGKMQKPEQYQIGIDTFERMKANCTNEEIIGACKLNIDKYIWRKKGSDIEDLKKAKDYIDLWIGLLEGKDNSTLFESDIRYKTLN
jgi:hypothetical protein